MVRTVLPVARARSPDEYSALCSSPLTAHATPVKRSRPNGSTTSCQRAHERPRRPPARSRWPLSAEQVARDDHALDLARALVDGLDAGVAEEPLHRELIDVPVASVDLDRPA